MHTTGTMRVRGNGLDAGEPWVEAAPFRAHLRHLVSASGLPLVGVALLAGVSPRFAVHLLHGRGGRPLRRISPDSARKLLRVTLADARAARHRVVPADRTQRHLQRLQREGWSQVDLAQLLGLSAQAVGDLSSGCVSSCSQLVALRAAAQVAVLLTPLPGAPSLARTAA